MNLNKGIVGAGGVLNELSSTHSITSYIKYILHNYMSVN